jgi:3-dehydroquinate synthase
MEFTCKAFSDRTYKILFEWGGLRRLRAILESEKLNGPYFIITDKNVYKSQHRNLDDALQGADFCYHIVPPGENSKSFKEWRRIQNFLLERGADRRAVVIAFGGGVIGDLAGFSASTYMRGLNLVQIPTTLLSQSDSSIGAKVAINHPEAKNMIGSFYQPRLVISDPSLLQTLPAREFSAGLGEAIKYGVIADPEILEMLRYNIEHVRSFNQEYVTWLISRCIPIKIRVVEEDERETGLRKILNFGHTIGHALEQATGYQLLRHGEAVAWGMLAAGWLAIRRNMWNADEFEKLKLIIVRSGALYPLGALKSRDVIDALKHDKKKTGKSLNFVLPEATGKVTIVRDVPQDEVRAAVGYILKFRH